MKHNILLLVLLIVFGSEKVVDAAAAVQAQKRQQATRQQLQEQQQLIQQQQEPRQIHQPLTPDSYAVRQQQMQRVRTSGPSRPSGGPTSHVKEDAIFDMLDDNSEVWKKVVKPDDKIYIVQHYIDQFRKDRVTIKRKAYFYAIVIDDLVRRNPQYNRQPFEQLLRIAAIMEYDFDNGDDKDHLALTVLGQNGYLANKKRLGLK